MTTYFYSVYAGNASNKLPNRFTWSHPQNWLVLILMLLAGAAIRQFFVLRHGYKPGRNSHLAGPAAVGVVVVGVIVWMRPVLLK